MCRNISLVLMLILAASFVAAEETIVIAGAGPSTRIVTEFFARFAETDAAASYVFTVPERSIKHAGGLKASDQTLFGRTGRPLTDDERGETRQEIFLGRIPLTFVIDPDLGISELSRIQLEDLLSGHVTNWQEIGGPDVPVKLVGREPTEAALMTLSEHLPLIADAPFALRLKKDHQLVQMMETPDRKGVLGFGAKGNFPPDQVLTVPGLDVGLAVGLVINTRNADHPLVIAVRAYAESKAWTAHVVALDMLPVN